MPSRRRGREHDNVTLGALSERMNQPCGASIAGATSRVSERTGGIFFATWMWDDDAGMAVMFHVYVAGAVDPSPDAQKKLAEIMASRYGLPIADVTARLAKGRFRVKATSIARRPTST